MSGADHLIVDLRGNAGGQLVAAARFRRRFVPVPSRIGTVRYSIGDGGVSYPYSFVDEPSDEVRWHRPVRFLIDALTYSASEDAILGDAVLTVSTGLTYDHLGRCVEGRGIGVDSHAVGPNAVDVADW